MIVEKVNENAENEQYERDISSYKNLSHKYFLGNSKNSSKQYNEMYAARLQLMRPILKKESYCKWGESIPVKTLQELDGSEVKQVIIIGTLFKSQDLKPSILKELSEENQLMPQPVLAKLTSTSDSIILEDELQRISLVGDIFLKKLVTGIVCAIKGKEENGGKFVVEDVCFFGFPAPSKFEAPINDCDKKIILLSGLSLYDEKSLLSLQLLVDYITGHLAQAEEQKEISTIVRVVIAGNSVCSSKRQIELKEKLKLIKVLDEILSQISSVCPVDVMPGEFDPTNYVLPQQPLHPCLFPKASSHSLLQCVTNPYEFQVDNRVFVGTSGQNVNDIIRLSEFNDPIEVLENIAQWGHLAPSAPDTLLSYPYSEVDPFIMSQCPDVLFASNQDQFASKVIKGKHKKHLLVSVPKFGATQTCVSISLKNLEIMPMNFSSDF